MPFTRPLEVYVHPLHPPLTPRQLERRALFSHHFGSTLPLPFIPRGGKPHRDPPPLPFWFPSPDRVISTRDAAPSPLSLFPSAAAAAHPPPSSAQTKSPSSDPKSSALPVASSASPAASSSSACTPVDCASLQLLPGYSYAEGATYSSPPGQRLRLHYLSAGEGAARCRSQVRSDGLRFNASGSRLLLAAREHVLVLNAAAVVSESCIACPGAAIVLPHNTHPDLVAVAGQEAYQQSPYVRLYDVRTPQSSSSSTTRSSSSGGSGGREESTPVVELWGPRHDGWWSACWSPVGEKVVCVDRRDMLHVFSLHEGMRRSAPRAAAASDSRTAGRGGGGTASPAAASVAAAGGRSSSSTTKRTAAAAAEAGDDCAASSSHDSSSSASARPKTPFASTPSGGVGRGGGGSAASAALSDAAGSSCANFKRSSSTASSGGAATPGTAASRTSSPASSSSSAATPRTPSPVYVHQLEGTVNACAFHPSGEFLLVAQDSGSLLVLPFDAASTTDPLLISADAPGPAGSAETMSLSLPLHQGGVTCCAADPSGRFVATGGSSSERCVLLLDAESMEVVGEVGRTEGGLQALSFSFDGQFLAWGCRDASAPSSMAVGVSGRGSGGESGGYSGGRSSSSESSEEKQETFLTIAGTDPCEIYLQCPTPAAVSAVAFHPRRYICAFATEADTTFAAAQQLQPRQGAGGATFWTKAQHPLQQQQPYNIGFLSFE